MRWGKRKSWLTDEEPFFGWRLIAPALEPAILELAEALAFPELWLYGELHGGGFPDLPSHGLQPVQTGIAYAPDLRWLVFDGIGITDAEDVGVWLSDSELREGNVVVAPRLAEGSRAALASVPVAFDSQVPELWGFSAPSPNLAEGLVLKPNARMAVGERPIYKRKIPEFDDAKFAAAENWNPPFLARSELEGWVDRLVGPARLASARSKVGEAPEAVVQEVGLDVAIDLAELFVESWRALTDEEQTAIQDLAVHRARQQLTDLALGS